MIWILGLMMVLICGNVEVNDYLLPTKKLFISEIEHEWRIDLPDPYKVYSIVNYKGFIGEGISYTVLQYREESKNTINKLLKWKEKDSFIREQIKKCFQFLEEWYDISDRERRAFDKYKKKLEGTYKYWYIRDMDEMSYAIVIWVEESGQMHIIEQIY